VRYGAGVRAPRGIPFRYPILLIATLIGIVLWMSSWSGRLQLAGRLPDYPRGTLRESQQDGYVDIAGWETADSLADIRAFYNSHARCADIQVTTDMVILECARMTISKERMLRTAGTITAWAVSPGKAYLRVEQYTVSQEGF
jgi:hypothetical protein